MLLRLLLLELMMILILLAGSQTTLAVTISFFLTVEYLVEKYSLVIW